LRASPHHTSAKVCLASVALKLSAIEAGKYGTGAALAAIFEREET